MADQPLETHPGFSRLFQNEKLTIGLTTPMERYDNALAPTMERFVERAQLAEQLGFAGIWCRDVPFNVPTFGDAGQMFDPFVYLGFLAAKTSSVALVTGSAILPLRHPVHVAKQAASLDQLSGGRFVMGVASGDRPEEFPAMAQDISQKSTRFRECFDAIRTLSNDFPQHDSSWGRVPGHMDLLPKPKTGQVPMLITGGSSQSPDWGAKHANGLITYPRGVGHQAQYIQDWRQRAIAQGETAFKPVAQSLYIDLVDNDNEPPSPIHLGFRAGVSFLVKYLQGLEDIGVNHVGINLRFNQADTEATMKRLAGEVLPSFPTHQG